jgi:short-subunit dehydrogenase
MSGSVARRVVLITGASGGIGAELARVFARHGHDLALVARSQPALEALADDIAAAGGPRPLVIPLDLAEPGAGAELASALVAQGARPVMLVNNAGFGLAGRSAELDRAEQIEMIDLNIRTLSDLTFRFLPDLMAARGRILNVASVAGFLPGPGMAVYHATKAYVVSFSQAIGQELRGAGVSVSTLCPGVTATGFHARAGLSASLLRGMPSMTAAAVAEAGYAGLMAGRRLIVPGVFNRVTVALVGLMPKALLLPLMDRLQTRRRHE